jgi:hypothetical protein
MINIGLVHPDVKRRRSSAFTIIQPRDVSETSKAALAEPERLLVAVELVPAASFCALEPEQARLLARSLMHMAQVIDQMRAAKKAVQSS